MKNNAFSKSLKPIVNIFRRYNVTIFIVTMVGGLVFAVYSLSSILTAPSTTGVGGPPPSSKNSFDHETIIKLNNLHSSDDNSSTQTPTAGRISPFSE